MSSHLLVWIILAVVLDGAAGLCGGLLPTQFLHKHLPRFLAFAAGTLISVAFLDLLPEALDTRTASHLWVLFVAGIGFCVLYVIEQFLGSHAVGQTGHRHGLTGGFILWGDALHNATDGVAIAAAFLTDVRVGIATSVAVIVHELPQEIGDYAILMAQGYSRARSLFLLVLVQFTALIGALAAYWAAQQILDSIPYLLGISAGGFIYVAAADLIPELHRQRSDDAVTSTTLSFLLGFALIAVLVFSSPH